MLPVHGLIIVELQPKINCNSTINLTKIRTLILWDLPKTLITAWSSAIILRTDLQKFLESIFKALLIGKPALQSHITGHARRLPSTSASLSRSWTGYPPKHTPPSHFRRQIKSHTFSGVAFFCVQPVCNFSVCHSPASFYHVHRHIHTKCLLHATATPYIALRDALGFLLW